MKATKKKAYTNEDCTGLVWQGFGIGGCKSGLCRCQGLPHGASYRMLQDGALSVTKAEVISNIGGASVVTYLRRGKNAVQQQKEAGREREGGVRKMRAANLKAPSPVKKMVLWPTGAKVLL